MPGQGRIPDEPVYTFPPILNALRQIGDQKKLLKIFQQYLQRIQQQPGDDSGFDIVRREAMKQLKEVILNTETAIAESDRKKLMASLRERTIAQGNMFGGPRPVIPGRTITTGGPRNRVIPDPATTTRDTDRTVVMTQSERRECLEVTNATNQGSSRKRRVPESVISASTRGAPDSIVISGRTTVLGSSRDPEFRISTDTMRNPDISSSTSNMPMRIRQRTSETAAADAPRARAVVPRASPSNDATQIQNATSFDNWISSTNTAQAPSTVNTDASRRAAGLSIAIPAFTLREPTQPSYKMPRLKGIPPLGVQEVAMRSAAPTLSATPCQRYVTDISKSGERSRSMDAVECGRERVADRRNAASSSSDMMEWEEQ
jgi:hypothetical protein